MFIEINRQWNYAWLWKLLVTWDNDLVIGYYPDWENARWKWRVW